MGFLQNFRQLIATISVTDVIDILVISVIIYYLILLVRETRAEQLIKGFVAILVIAQLSSWLNLHTVNWLLSNVLTAGFILVIVVFQPEIRRAFERLGRSQGWLNNLVGGNEVQETSYRDEEIVRACTSLSRQKIGALIVLEGNTGLGDIDTGTQVDGLVTTDLLINIFIPNTPLHDGAVIVRGDRILVAAAVLPLTQNKNLDRELGTRHRAALGISERSDALVVVVSEETGNISICQNGRISRFMDEDSLREALREFGEGPATGGSMGKINMILSALRRRPPDQVEADEGGASGESPKKKKTADEEAPLKESSLMLKELSLATKESPLMVKEDPLRISERGSGAESARKEESHGTSQE